LASGFLPSSIILSAFIVSSMRNTWPGHGMILTSITAAHKTWRTLKILLQLTAWLIILGPNIPLCTLFSDASPLKKKISRNLS
jgi:hypothetical protein